MFYQNKCDMLESTGYTVIQLLYKKSKALVMYLSCGLALERKLLVWCIRTNQPIDQT